MGSGKPKDELVEKQKEEQKKEKPKPRIERREVEGKELIRVANTDLDGKKTVIQAIKSIKGIGHTMAKVICSASGFNPNIKLGSLDENGIVKLEGVIRNPENYGVPAYLLNRRKDIETGKDIHLTGSDVDVAKRFDIQRMVNIKTYRGWRHMLGQPVRGQSTRSSFRQKGRAVGVMKKAVKLQMEQQKKAETEKK